MSSRIVLPVLAALLAAASSTALAAGNDLDLGNAMLRPADSTTKEVGIGVAIAPGYLGAANHRGYVGIDVETNFGNGFFISSQSGLGYRFLETPSGWSMAASLGVSPSRREKDGDHDHPNRLRGMGDVDAKAQANLYLNYDNGPFHVNAGLHQTLASRRGTSLDLTVGYDLYADPNNLIRASAAAVYANRSLMQTFFGVTQQQGFSSGQEPYKARAGLADGELGLSWRHALNDHWISTVDVGVARLRGDAADSPLTVRRTNGVASASIAYRF